MLPEVSGGPALSDLGQAVAVCIPAQLLETSLGLPTSMPGQGHLWFRSWSAGYNKSLTHGALLLLLFYWDLWVAGGGCVFSIWVTHGIQWKQITQLVSPWSRAKLACENFFPYTGDVQTLWGNIWRIPSVLSVDTTNSWNSLFSPNINVHFTIFTWKGKSIQYGKMHKGWESLH